MPQLGLNGRGEVKARRAVAQKFCWRRRAVDRETRAHGVGKARFGSGASMVVDAALSLQRFEKKMRRTLQICNRLRDLDNARVLDSYR